MVCNDKEYIREKNDGKMLLTKDIDKAISKFFAMDIKQRLTSPYIGETRASVFIGACVIFKTIYQILLFENMIVSYKCAQDAILEELQSNG